MATHFSVLAWRIPGKADWWAAVYGVAQNWTLLKKAEHLRIDAFELWCWRRLLRVPWTTRRSNQSILKEISPGCSLEGMMLKLKLQNFGCLMRRVDSLEKTDAGRDWGQVEKGTTEDEMAGWHHWLDGHEFEWTPGDGDGVACCDSWGRKESDMTEQLNRTELTWSALAAAATLETSMSLCQVLSLFIALTLANRLCSCHRCCQFHTLVFPQDCNNFAVTWHLEVIL